MKLQIAVSSPRRVIPFRDIDSDLRWDFLPGVFHQADAAQFQRVFLFSLSLSQCYVCREDNCFGVKMEFRSESIVHKSRDCDNRPIVATRQSAVPYNLLMTRDPRDEVSRLNRQVLPNSYECTDKEFPLTICIYLCNAQINRAVVIRSVTCERNFASLSSFINGRFVQLVISRTP